MIAEDKERRRQTFRGAKGDDGGTPLTAPTLGHSAPATRSWIVAFRSGERTETKSPFRGAKTFGRCRINSATSKLDFDELGSTELAEVSRVTLRACVVGGPSAQSVTGAVALFPCHNSDRIPAPPLRQGEPERSISCPLGASGTIIRSYSSSKSLGDSERPRGNSKHGESGL
jgi:hypothetical protein